MNSDLWIREIEPPDSARLNRYWAEASDADLARMGELARPDASSNDDFIAQLCAERPPPERAEEAIRIWMRGDVPIGYSTCKAIRFGEDAQIHLHMWDGEQRGKGQGAALFCQSALAFMALFRLRALYCQPKADNPMPNRMLRRIGFALLGAVDAKRADGTVIQQNRYAIERARAEAFLSAYPA